MTLGLLSMSYNNLLARYAKLSNSQPGTKNEGTPK